jgi:hypothetical protein
VNWLSLRGAPTTPPASFRTASPKSGAKRRQIITTNVEKDYLCFHTVSVLMLSFVITVAKNF